MKTLYSNNFICSGMKVKTYYFQGDTMQAITHGQAPNERAINCTIMKIW
jgi:hypothetical protein